MKKTSLIATICCGVFGVAFLVVGLSMIPVFKNLIHNKIKENIPIAVDSETYKDFLTPPAPIYFQIWLFDIVNHDEVLKTGDKPYLLQKGPYTYREERLKVNVTFNENNTVSYRENRWFIFEEDKSAGPQSDTLTTLNIPVAVIDNLVKNEYALLKELVELLLSVSNEQFFVTLTVEDLMWGYEDPLLKRADDILKRFNKTIDDHFGLFYGKNGTDDGLYTVFTGKGDVTKHGHINKWNGMKSLPYWTSLTAAMLNGSDGTMYQPFLDDSEDIYVFSSDVCRSLGLKFQKEYDLKDIEVYRFVAPASLFENNTANPANTGFCTEAEGCLPSGIIDVSACRNGAPIVLSQPHFLAADPSILNSVYGLHPSTEEHRTVLDVEPMTGTTMNAAKKLQINVHIMNVSHMAQTSKLKSMFMPILWLNESAVIDDKSVQTFKDKLQEPVKITQAVQFGLIILGVFILVCMLVFIVKKTKCNNTKETDLEPMIQ